MIELTAERPVAGGRMLARHDGRVVLIAGAIPGERVRVAIERATRGVSFARVRDVIEPSADRRDPPCDPACGGAGYAHIRYERQLELKAEIVADALRRIARIPQPPSIVVQPSPERAYRLRARLHVRQRRAGFLLEGTHVLCDAGATGQLLPETMEAIDATLAALDNRLAECDALTIAENAAGSNRVVHIEPRDGARFDDLRARLPLPAGLSGLTTGRRDELTTLAGAATVTDRAADLPGSSPPLDPLVSWTRRASSFFQGNRYLTGTLVRRVLEARRGDRFVDLYAGVGLFAVALAAAGATGLAVEGDRSSAADLDANASVWRARLRTMRASVEDAVTMPLDPAPDLVVLDPPRTGVTPEALRGVTAWAAPRVIYVSCDPPTLARDAARLAEHGYALTALEAFDLFPNTPHVEVLATFDLP